MVLTITEDCFASSKFRGHNRFKKNNNNKTTPAKVPCLALVQFLEMVGKNHELITSVKFGLWAYG